MRSAALVASLLLAAAPMPDPTDAPSGSVLLEVVVPAGPVGPGAPVDPGPADGVPDHADGADDPSDPGAPAPGSGDDAVDEDALAGTGGVAGAAMLLAFAAIALLAGALLVRRRAGRRAATS